ncbi:LOW QUALITY PROTEIN: hypothetical protein PanWU01x14_155610 [Parasponia andersonii]|uniref:Transmembrane protein n=1 Tax=Parasponia andersonii TaxID=3476 RepID=A0A2P5CG78_PARAD|nr:LOW QUALITY PROTEIN: hypothetical protein PanWU01x14_155610 [Parasponia andersonii]
MFKQVQEKKRKKRKIKNEVNNILVVIKATLWSLFLTSDHNGIQLGQSSYPSLVIVIVFHSIIPVFAARLFDLELEGDECSLFPRGIRLVHEANNDQT